MTPTHGQDASRYIEIRRFLELCVSALTATCLQNYESATTIFMLQIILCISSCKVDHLKINMFILSRLPSLPVCFLSGWRNRNTGTGKRGTNWGIQ